MREAGLVGKDVPRIHCRRPTEEDHTIYDPFNGARIWLSLQGAFSGFKTRPLSQYECEHVKDS